MATTAVLSATAFGSPAGSDRAHPRNVRFPNQHHTVEVGRSLTDLLDVLGELHAAGVGLYLHQQGLDTTTPSGRTMFQMMGVFPEFERAIIRERVMAGLARAREEGAKLGRRHIEDADPRKARAIGAALAAKTGIRRIARDLSVGVGTVIRIRDQTVCRVLERRGAFEWEIPAVLASAPTR